LQLNLGKSKEIALRRLSVQLDILPVGLSLQLHQIERLECLKLLGVLLTRK